MMDQHRSRTPVAIIRAAGRGERMGELTRYFQKCMLPVNGRPLIVHWTSALLLCGVERHIIHHYRGDQVINAVQTFEEGFLTDGHGFTTSSMMRLPGIWEDTCRQIETLRYLQNRPVLLCYADNYSGSLIKIIKDLLNTIQAQDLLDVDAIIGVIPNNRCSTRTQKAVLGRGGVTLPNWQGEDFPLQQVCSVLDYRIGLTDADGWAWAGIGVFRPGLFRDRIDFDTTTVLSFLASQGRLAALRITDDYRDIGTFWDQISR